MILLTDPQAQLHQPISADLVKIRGYPGVCVCFGLVLRHTGLGGENNA